MAPSAARPKITLPRRQRETLRAICDTFAAAEDLGGASVPAASELGVVEEIERGIAGMRRKADRRQFTLLLALLGTRALTAFGGGGARRFATLSQPQRERVLLSWADSRSPQRRAVFQALRKACLAMTYTTPGPNGRNPRWDLIGYPGPPGDAPDTPKPLTPLQVDGDTRLECDVVVVGSGAGGGTAAAVLAQAGLNVVIVEAGGYFNESDFDGAELEGLRRLYLGAGGMATVDQSVGLLAGSCLGGGTVVNYTTSFRTPDEVRREWARRGATTFIDDEYERAMDAVCERLGVNHEHSKPSTRDVTMKRGLDALGWHSDFVPRNVRGCEQGDRCGFCGYGCPYGAKQSTLRTWIEDAVGAGARLVTDTFVERVVTRDRAAAGIEGQHEPSGSRVTIDAKAVVCAAGSLHTPALLKRSGLRNAMIGKNLHLHPATGVWGVFDDPVEPWNGTMQAVYSDQHRDLDGDGYGLKYETAPGHPTLITAFGPWRSSRQHLEMMQALSHSSVVGVLLRDRGGGEVRTGRDGEPIVHYALSDSDRAHLRVGIEGAAQILQAAGAQQVFTSHTQLVRWDTGGSIDALMGQADAAGYGAGQCQLASFHIMGSARMGGAAGDSVCDPHGQVWELDKLVVCDASAFPSASGVNPMISIEAIAWMNATALAARLS